jgi:hypothetical protein
LTWLVAPYWLRTLPPRRSERPRGFPRRACPAEPRPRELLSWSWAPLQSSHAPYPPAPHVSGLSLSPIRPTDANRTAPETAGPPLLEVPAPFEHYYVGCPFFSPTRPLSRTERTKECHSSAGAVPRVLAPLDGSSRARGTARALAELAVTPWRPDASRPYSMPLTSPWSCPTEPSPPEEPYPLSWAFRAPWRVRIRPPPARRGTNVDGHFPRRANSLPDSPPEGGRRRMSRDGGSPMTARSTA